MFHLYCTALFANSEKLILFLIFYMWVLVISCDVNSERLCGKGVLIISCDIDYSN